MKRALIAIFIVLVTSPFLYATEGKEEKKGAVNWITFEEAVALNKTSPKKIFIDVYTDWCGWCKVMDKNTFSQPDIAAYLNENFHAVKLNAEQKEDIEFMGNTFKFVPQGKRGYHELAAALLQGQMSYPTVVFMDENNQLLQPIPGYQKPKQFDVILHFFGESAYKEMSWEDFQQTFQSSF
jgi:thioredoxin-related protein